jgi:sarcosine oxidase subunit alpha
MSRLQAGGLVDRDRLLKFTFDGHSYAGFAGDTLASALVANDVKLVGRSFKYHRPRGLLTAGSEEPNALVELRTQGRREPNTRATTTELFDGLVASSQNRWPSLAFDLPALNQLFSPRFVAGFYYKTFMWPASFWEKIYEPLIRRAAGLGRASGLPDPVAYERATAFCDVLVIGSGPAGLMAARTAARAGARVILCEDDFSLGGRLLAERDEIDGRPGAEFARSVEDELTAMPDVRIFRRTQVFGAYDGGLTCAGAVADHRQPPRGLPPAAVAFCGEALHQRDGRGRTIAFADNDRPASCWRRQSGPFSGLWPLRAVKCSRLRRRRTALICAAGTEVLSCRPRRGSALLVAVDRCPLVARRQGHQGLWWIARFEGRHCARSLGVQDRRLPSVSGGWNPQIALTTHKGGRPRWSPEVSAFVPSSLPEGMSIAGAVSGDYGSSACLQAGSAAGAAAAEDCGFTGTTPEIPRSQDEAVAVAPLWHVTGGRGKSFVDQQNDVTVADIEIAWREGFRAVEHLKRYTTLGMATDQGKHLYAIMAERQAAPVEETGTSVTRPPHLLLRRICRPARPTCRPGIRPDMTGPSDQIGPWLRPQWFSTPSETDWLASVIREVKTTRSAVGVCDVSTLGKIDVKGADAGIFLDRIYINKFSTLPVGKTRYGVMLREDGFVMEDGTAARLGPQHYVVSTKQRTLRK